MFLEFLHNTHELHILKSRIFSTGVAAILSFVLAMSLFQPYIKILRRLHFSSELNGKDNITQPVMPAGILFLMIITFVTLLTARINSYVVSALLIYVFFSIIGAVDDIAKVVNKGRLSRGKISKEEYMYKADGISTNLRLGLYILISLLVAIVAYKFIPKINGNITIPFLSITKKFPYFPFWLFIPFMTLTIAIVANGVNFTDGFDTLSVVPLLTCITFAGIISYISSNTTWSSYLLIPHIPDVEETLPMTGAVAGTLLAFLWYNSPPSSIIMGDSGSIGLGGLVAILFIFIKAGFYIPIVGLIFMIEFLSSFLQIGYYKLTGKRLFLCAPIHHHFQIKMRRSPRYPNEFLIKSKIAWRFHIVSIVMLILGLIVFLKIR
ncbi:MAG: phospho-N-acetylmuramoyl-pentapeptide-transferase [Chitinivibrionales bacterium]